MRAASIPDFRQIARARLPRFLFEYIDGGSFDERTLARNRADLGDIYLRQRVLRDVAHVETGTSLLGEDWRLPVALAPVGLAGLAARRGEVQAARAADAAGIPFCLSTVSACSIEEVRAGGSRPFWFQLYMLKDRGFMRALLDQAREAGCRTQVFTVDLPVPGARYRDVRSGLAGAPGLTGKLRRAAQAMARPAWALDVGLLGQPHSLGNIAPLLGPSSGLEDFFAWMRGSFDPSISWQDLDWVRRHWDGPLILKGILDADDARAAVSAGCDALVVSNHGGRQLDGVRSTAQVLPEIARAVGDQTTVLADGGVRSGLDVLRMLALGAQGVLLGRAWVFALAAGGQEGVARMLSILDAELRVAMALTGVSRIQDISGDILDRSSR